MYRELTDRLRRRDSAAVYKEQPNRTENRKKKRIQKKVTRVRPNCQKKEKGD